MKVVVLLSGGLDSSTLLYKALDDGHEVHALSFSYGSKQNYFELRGAKKICNITEVPWRAVDLTYLNDLLTSALLEGGEEIPEGLSTDESMKKTTVPFRNGIFVANAIGYAESNGIDEVWFGARAMSHGKPYPDCRPDFTYAMNLTSLIGTDRKVYVKAPFDRINKIEILELGLTLGVPYQYTYTCYNGKARPCLKCSTCIERGEAFVTLEVMDPALTKEEWNTARDIYYDAIWKKQEEE